MIVSATLNRGKSRAIKITLQLYEPAKERQNNLKLAEVREHKLQRKLAKLKVSCLIRINKIYNTFLQ